MKSVNSNSEPCVSAPIRSASSVSRNVSVCELGPYASTLISTSKIYTEQNDENLLKTKNGAR